jgi:glycerol-3-phosphate dehydrogenase (NAD+)
MGKRLTKGESIADITASMTVEGVPTAQVAIHFADKCGLDLPIFRTVAAILRGDMRMEDAHVHLMGRPLRSLHHNN